MSSIITEITVSLPVPPMALSKNTRVHWAKRHTVFQAHKLMAMSRIREACDYYPPVWGGPVTVSVRWYAKRRQWPDTDNAIGRLAAFVDGAQDADLFVNDRQIIGYHVEFDVDKQNPRVEMTFTEGER